MIECAYVYILSSSFKHLYIGVTTDLKTRVWQHKNSVNPTSFTSKYKMDQLVYFERHALIVRAIKREKQLKGWLRIKKVQLIVENNPTWQDLSRDWWQPLRPQA